VTQGVASLCSGYDGLGLALGISPTWYAETDPAACSVMEANHPGVPNVGDVTTVAWDDCDPPDIVTAGYPCQPFSYAGRRKGTSDARHLWPHIAECVRVLRPRWVLLENVPGHLSLGACTVVGDLAAMGYDTRWGVVSAAEAGLCHRRDRWWCIAARDAADLGRERLGLPRHRRGRPADADRGPAVAALLPTPNAGDGTGGGVQYARGNPTLAGALLPTPQAEHGRPSQNLEWHGGTAYRPSGAKASVTTAEAIDALLPTPTVNDSRGGRNATSGRTKPVEEQTHAVGWTLCDVAFDNLWNRYGPAVDRHARLVGRPAPSPVVANRNAKRGVSLNPVFVEWMMGLPEGWVTGHGLPRTAALRVLGNGVVPQQAALAFGMVGWHP
jgi:DNA (cytosine-5)-methyltransferase 1